MCHEVITSANEYPSVVLRTAGTFNDDQSEMEAWSEVSLALCTKQVAIIAELTR